MCCGTQPSAPSPLTKPNPLYSPHAARRPRNKDRTLEIQNLTRRKRERQKKKEKTERKEEALAARLEFADPTTSAPSPSPHRLTRAPLRSPARTYPLGSGRLELGRHTSSDPTRLGSDRPSPRLTSLSDPIRPMDPIRHLVRPTSALSPSPPPRARARRRFGHTTLRSANTSGSPFAPSHSQADPTRQPVSPPLEQIDPPRASAALTPPPRRSPPPSRRRSTSSSLSSSNPPPSP